jgi:hypothetical protein
MNNYASSMKWARHSGLPDIFICFLCFLNFQLSFVAHCNQWRRQDLTPEEARPKLFLKLECINFHKIKAAHI